jgi:hypothetical protein
MIVIVVVANELSVRPFATITPFSQKQIFHSEICNIIFVALPLTTSSSSPIKFLNSEWLSREWMPLLTFSYTISLAKCATTINVQRDSWFIKGWKWKGIFANKRIAIDEAP